MKIISNLQADRLIAQVQSEPDPSAPAAKKALEKLKRLGDKGIPRILQALAGANKAQTVEYVEILSSLMSEKSFPGIVQGLADADPKIVAGTAWALSSNRRYNPNRLVDLLADDV